jgi:hypothetical protein
MSRPASAPRRTGLPWSATIDRGPPGIDDVAALVAGVRGSIPMAGRSMLRIEIPVARQRLCAVLCASGVAAVVLILAVIPLVRPVHIRAGGGELFAASFWRTDVMYDAGYHDYRHWFYGWHSRELVLILPVGSGWVYRVEYRTPR